MMGNPAIRAFEGLADPPQRWQTVLSGRDGPIDHWIVVPEALRCPRVMRAARTYVERYDGRVVFIGDADELHEAARGLQWRVSPTRVRRVDPPAGAGIGRLISCGTALIARGEADGMVAGAVATSAEVFKPAIRYLRRADSWVSEGAILVTRDRRLVAFADCAVIPDPTAQQLAAIAREVAAGFEHLTGEVPVVAFLAFSTKGSAEAGPLDKPRAALALLRREAPHLLADGELQFDAAYRPDIAAVKAPDSLVQGNANVFIFPDLNSANIGLKIAQFVGDAEVLCLVPRGLRRPVVDLSRGSDEQTITRSLAACARLCAEDHDRPVGRACTPG